MSENRFLVAEKNIRELKIDIIESCKICGGAGFERKPLKIDENLDEIDNLNKVENFERCECGKKFDLFKNLTLSNIEKEFWDCEKWRPQPKSRENWHDFIHPYANKLEEAKEKGISLLFIGANGLGKTYAAIYILIKAIRKKYSSHYITFTELYDLINKVTIQKNINDINLLAEISTVDFLVIDELGKRKGTETVINEFENFIRKRIYRKKNLILISNLSSEDFFQDYFRNIESIAKRMKTLLFMGEY